MLIDAKQKGPRIQRSKGPNAASVADPDTGPGWIKIGIRDKRPGSATLIAAIEQLIPCSQDNKHDLAYTQAARRCRGIKSEIQTGFPGPYQEAQPQWRQRY